jgi:predicted lipid-binding transport protein (Tim44 family)
MPFPIAVIVFALALAGIAIVVAGWLLFLLVKLGIAIYRAFFGRCEWEGCHARKRMWIRLTSDPKRKRHLCLEHGRELVGSDHPLIQQLSARQQPTPVASLTVAEQTDAAARTSRQAAAAVEQTQANRRLAASAELEARKAHGWRRWVYGPLTPANSQS